MSQSDDVSWDFFFLFYFLFWGGEGGWINYKFNNHFLFLILYTQILKEDPTYPEALIGRGTAYAFQRELEAAIADFTKVFE